MEKTKTENQEKNIKLGRNVVWQTPKKRKFWRDVSLVD